MKRDRTKEYEKRKQQRIERKEKGLCTRCGIPLTDTRYLQCERCRKAFRLLYYPVCKRTTGFLRTNYERGECGDCWLCGKKLPEGYFKKKCPECIEKSRQGYFRNHKAKENKE